MAKGIHEDALSLEYERFQLLALKFVLWDEHEDMIAAIIKDRHGKALPTPEQVLQACKDALTMLMLRVSLSGLFRKVK